MRILHVEDEPWAIETVRHVCAVCETVSAPSLVSAREALALSSFDLLLVDLNLPDSQGSDTVEALKPYCLPIVVLTSDRNPQYAVDCRILGVSDFILKDEITRPGFCARLMRVHTAHLKRWGGKCNLAFPDFVSLKPYLSTASAFATLSLAANEA